MKFKIDRRFIASQTFKAIAGYLIGLLIVLWFLDIKEPLDFIVISLVAGILVYFMSVFPRKIIVIDGIMSFVEKYGWERCRVKLTDITDMETEHKLYNTVILMTRSGKKYILHPKDAMALKDAVFSGKQTGPANV